MTGFGHATATHDEWCLSVEVRAVNHRGLDVRARVPAEHARLTKTVTEAISARLTRGRVEVNVALANERASADLTFDASRAATVLDAARQFAVDHELAVDITLGDLISVPGIVTAASPALPTTALVESLLTTALKEAVDGLLEARESEGTQLHKVLRARLGTLDELTDQIAARTDDASARLRSALHDRLQAASVVVDDQRLAQEVALLADRADVHEELDRLRAHTSRARELLDAGGSVGRKLDFLCQELNREANTVGSKTQDAQTAHIVVELKSEIERVREQVQNLE